MEEPPPKIAQVSENVKDKEQYQRSWVGGGQAQGQLQLHFEKPRGGGRSQAGQHWAVSQRAGARSWSYQLWMEVGKVGQAFLQSPADSHQFAHLPSLCRNRELLCSLPAAHLPSPRDPFQSFNTGLLAVCGPAVGSFSC